MKNFLCTCGTFRYNRHIVVSTRRTWLVNGWFLLAALWLGGCTSTERAADVSRFTGPWFYRWGDAPRLPHGDLAWSRPKDDVTQWHAMTALGSPPGRASNDFLWVRTQLPDTRVADPVLYLRGVDQIFEAYLDGKLIYHFGSFEGPEALRFLGYKSHYIPLGQAPQGKTLALRIHSHHVNIGLFGETLIGSQMALVTEVTRRDLPTLAMGIITLSIGAFVLFLFVVRRKERGYLTYGLLALTMGAYFAAASPSRQLIADAPLFWLHAELFSLYLLGGFLAAYVEQLFGAGARYIIRWLKRAFFLFAAIAAFLVVTGLVPVLATLLPNQILLLIASITFTIHVVQCAWRDLPNARIFAIGFVSAAGAGVYDLLGAMGILSRGNLPIGYVGFFVFTIAMGLILARRFLEVQDRLGQYSTVLGLSLASARVLEPGQQARVALDELLSLLKARRALLFLAEPEGSERAGKLELRAVREVGETFDPNTTQSVVGSVFRKDIIERVRTEHKPFITSSNVQGKRRSAMAAPLLVRDELVGVLYLEGADGRRAFDEADLAVLLGLGTQLSITIITTRAVRLEVQTALQQSRIEKQTALLQAASRMAQGDLETPIVVDTESDLAPLGRTLDEMRCDVRSQIKMLEARNVEVQVLNDELRRKIEERTMTLLAALVDGSTKAAPALLKPGAMIGDRYRVGRRLGAGAMGIVYAVERVSDGKPLAIKLLTQITDKPSIARFIREAHILSRLDHPNLVSIFDVDITPAGHLYLVMELFAGTTLDKFRDKPLRWCLSALAQIAAGLAAVHTSGVVHRDLKPSNVLVMCAEDGSPRVKLVDFGVSTLAEPASLERVALATRMDGDELETLVMAAPTPAAGKVDRVPEHFQVTATGALVGTPLYMAPELGSSMGKASSLRSSSDMFSVGVMAYELLTKERPFDGPPIFLMAIHGRLEPPMGLRRVPGISLSLTVLLERCLASNAEARPTARDLADALGAEAVAAA